jgi:hypothetical protein
MPSLSPYRALPAGWLHELYTHQQDSNLITAEHTEALLKQLQRTLQALPPAPAAAPSLQSALSNSVSTASISSLPAAAAKHLQLLSVYQNSHTVNPSRSSSLNTSPAAGLQPFIVAAGDVLSYLRYKQSQALLPLLRSFSQNGLKGVAVLASNPAVLRQEVQQLLQPVSLQQWYVEAARSRVGAAATSVQQPSTAFLVSLLCNEYWHWYSETDCGGMQELVHCCQRVKEVLYSTQPPKAVCLVCFALNICRATKAHQCGRVIGA